MRAYVPHIPVPDSIVAVLSIVCAARAAPCARVLAVWLCLVSASTAAAEREEARAFARDDGRLLYRETHWRDRIDGVPRRVVLYRCPDGRAFARKSVHVYGDAMQPDVHYVDARTGYSEGVRTRDGRREMFVERDGARRTRALPDAGMPAVIDAGFDAAVRARWAAFDAGPQRLAFLLPERFVFMPVRVSRVGDEAGVRHLRMTVDRWFGAALPSIELRYGLDDRRLREFAGPGTVRDARGRPRDVRIVFPATPPAVAAPSDIAAALSDPLEGRCTV